MDLKKDKLTNVSINVHDDELHNPSIVINEKGFTWRWPTARLWKMRITKTCLYMNLRETVEVV